MQAAAEPMRKPPKMDESDVGLVTGDIKKLEAEANRLGRLTNDSFEARLNFFLQLLVAIKESSRISS